jgi:hypothetical protein
MSMLIQAKAMTYPCSSLSGGGGVGGHAMIGGGGGDFSFNNNNNINSGGGSYNNNNNSRHHEIMTYSSYVNGSIFTIPKCWSEENTDQVLLTVYSFIKTFVG